MADDTDITSASAKNFAGKRFNLATFIVMTGFIVSITLAAGIVAIALWFAVTHPNGDIPKPLSDWAGIAMGFFFATFFPVVKSFIEK